MIESIGYAATKGLLNAFNNLEPMSFYRRDVGEQDVQIEVLYCGVCHSDVHQVKNEWMNTVYPSMPGHEIIGRVQKVGASVTDFKAGDIVGVGCMIDSCGECRGCQDGLEQYCEGPQSWLATYNGYMKPADKDDPANTFGGYSDVLVVKDHFVLHIPDSLDIKSAGPILCAGVTTYSPIKEFGVQAGWKVGVVGLGGLGHLAVKIMKAMGAHVTVFTSHKDEKAADIRNLGAENVIDSEDEDAMKKEEVSYDFILSTIPESHDVNPYICLLKRDARIVLVGVLTPMPLINQMELAMHRRSYCGSLIGSIAETQEVLNFFAEHNIAPDVEMIDIQDINDAYDRVEKGDVHYRFVIDMASLKKENREDATKAPDKQATY